MIMHKWQGKLPILLSILFAATILVLSVIKLRNWVGARLFWGSSLILLYLCWLGLESKVALGELGREETSRDRVSCELYAAGRGATVVAALAVPTRWIEWGGLPYAGILVFVMGVGFRTKAIKVLGDRYSHRVRKQDEHEIVTRGPYSIVRHPAYIGMLVAHLGFVLFFFNWLSFVMLFGFLLPTVVNRIGVEEKDLRQLESYVEYSKNKKRLLPHLW
jgi:protein-S-isoprenylcysteine O-methyltransferase Ste14